MEYVTLVNRSSKTLEGVWDGRHYDLKPGKHSFPEAMAMKFKDQNPIMGTEDPMSLQRQHLIGIEEFGDNCSPIEQSTAPVMNAGTLEKIRKGELILVRADHPFNRIVDSAPSPFAVASDGKTDTSFVKP